MFTLTTINFMKNIHPLIKELLFLMALLCTRLASIMFYEKITQCMFDMSESTFTWIIEKYNKGHSDQEPTSIL